MPDHAVDELRRRTDAAFTALTRQLAGMEAHLERADAPGEWTTRRVLAPLLFEPGWDPVAVLRRFSELIEHRKARIPLFKQFMGTVEVALGRYVGALFDYQRNDHAGQLAKIRRAVGLPAV